jgi:hypothetical protein
MNPIIPSPVPIPLPAPAWLIHLLQLLTFVLHLVFMNLLVGGTLILTLSCYLGRKNFRHRDLARRAARALPPVFAFTITLGVAPLLFLQLAYGQLFYTTSILMAWSWLAIVLLLILAYYGVYWFTMQQEELGPRGMWVMLGVTVLLLVIMKTFTQNLTLVERPQDFYATFLSGTVGNYLGPHSAFVFARLSHFFVAALAIGGLGLAVLAQSWQKESADFAVWARNYGLRWFLAGTGVQFLVGLWFLFSQPESIRLALMGSDGLATALFVIAIALAILAMVVARKSLAAAVIGILGTISLMAVLRHQIRLLNLQPSFDVHALPVQGQWAVFVIFAVLLVAGLATVGWMLFQFFYSGVRSSSSA